MQDLLRHDTCSSAAGLKSASDPPARDVSHRSDERPLGFILTCIVTTHL